MNEKKVFLLVDLDSWSEWEKKNPEVSLIALNWYANFIQRITSKTGAYIFDHSEKCYSITYDSPDIAFSALLEIGESIFGEKWPGIGALPAKIIAHYGEADFSNNVYSGKDAARSTSLLRYASNGNVFITQAFKDSVKSIPGNVKINKAGTVKLDDNFSEETIFSILFFDYHADTSSITRSARVESNFVPQKMNFIGRDEELLELLGLFKDYKYRIIGITGPAGIGKTRLALQVASELRTECIDGSFLVDLSFIKDLELVPCVISEVLRVEKISEINNDSLLDRLVTLIHVRKIILILDGIDHIKNLGGLVKRLIKECPYLKIITTSENIPDIENIDVYPLEPMKMPLESDFFHIKMLPAYPAVEFVLKTSIFSGAGIDISDLRLGNILEICKMLNGNPYAMGLFIANYKSLRLRDFSSLINQQGYTLNSVIKYVYDNALTAEEKTFLAAVSVFEPSFNNTDAETLCVAAGIELQKISFFYEELYNKLILFRMTVPDGTAGYYINPQIKTFVQMSEGEAIKKYTRLYEDLLMELSDRYEKEQGTKNASKLTREITRRINNFRMLLFRLIEEGKGDRAIKLLMMFAALDYNIRTFFEVPFWYEKVLKILDTEKYRHEILFLEIRKGWRMTILSDREEFLNTIMKVLQVAEKNEYFDIQILALNQLGFRSLLDKEIEKAFEYFEKAVRLIDKIDDPLLIADAYIIQSRGWISRDNKEKFLEFALKAYKLLKKYDRYYSVPYLFVLNELEYYYCQIADFDSELFYLAELKKLNEELEDKIGMAGVISRFGKMEKKKGNYEKASEYFKEALDYYSESAYISGVSSVMIHLSDCDFQMGNYSIALDEGIEGLKLSYETYSLRNLGKALLLVGLAYQKLGFFSKAVFMLGAYKSFITKRISVKRIFDADEIDINLYINELRSKLSQKDFASAWMNGFNGNMDTVILEVLKGNLNRRQ